MYSLAFVFQQGEFEKNPLVLMASITAIGRFIFVSDWFTKKGNV